MDLMVFTEQALFYNGFHTTQPCQSVFHRFGRLGLEEWVLVSLIPGVWMLNGFKIFPDGIRYLAKPSTT